MRMVIEAEAGGVRGGGRGGGVGEGPEEVIGGGAGGGWGRMKTCVLNFLFGSLEARNPTLPRPSR